MIIELPFEKQSPLKQHKRLPTNQRAFFDRLII